MPRSANTEFRDKSKTFVDNVRIVDVGVEAEASSLVAASGFKPDPWKAYIEFDICHTLPEFAGPVQAGNYIGWTADTLEKSHSGLLHQQFNISHLLKSYGEDNSIPKDRIIGCVVATSFPKKPMGGWVPGQSIPIRAAATIFKLADGVSKLLGDHLTSRKKQSVSIETITPFGNIGVHRPSTGETWPILALPDEVIPALKEMKGSVMPHVGKLNGEQLLVIYGIGQPISLRGVAMTPNPAERAARIVAVQAQKKELDAETMFLVTAEEHTQELVGSEIKFKSGRKGTVEKVFTEGMASIAGSALRMKASAEDPVLLVKLPDNRRVLRPCSGL